MKEKTVAKWLSMVLVSLSFLLGQAWACGNMPSNVPPPPPPQPPKWSIDGLWWASPAGSESGWGLSIDGQGDHLFATWFTYDTDGSPMWIVMPEGRWSYSLYTGTLYRTTGPSFSTGAWDPSQVAQIPIGSGSLNFYHPNLGLFDAQISEGDLHFRRVWPITRFVFGPSAIAGEPTEPNYAGVWWNSPAGSEPGWGVSIAHQSGVLMAAWFTYRSNGEGEWLVMPSSVRTGNAAYSGTLYRNRGPAFNTRSWDVTKVSQTAAGTATFSFGEDGNNGVFAYTLDGVSQSKPITRYFNTPSAGVGTSDGGNNDAGNKARGPVTKGCAL